MRSVTNELATIIVETPAAALSEELREKAGKIIVDTLACIVSGAGSETAPPLLDYVANSGSSGMAPILGTSSTASAEMAALVNGSFGHALEYDDVFSMMPGHPAAVIVAALISNVDRRPVSERAFTEAFILGYETGARMGIAMTLEHHRVRGFHATSTLGIFAAVAALARLRKLDVRPTATAISAAASFASGLLAQIGTSMKPIHSGWAARNAVAAVRMIESGVLGGLDVLEANRGFFSAYGTDKSKPERVVDGFGAPWALISPGVVLKKYPCCFAAHRGIDALVDLRSEHRIVFADVESVSCRVPPKGLVNMIHHHPQTGLEAKFSMEYAFAATLLDGEPTLETFTDGMVRRDIMQRSFERIVSVEDPACEIGLGEASGEVSGIRGFIDMTVRMKDGSVYSKRVTQPPGSPKRELSWSELERKCAVCAGHAGLSSSAAAQMVLSLMSYRGVEDIAVVLRSLSKQIAN